VELRKDRTDLGGQTSRNAPIAVFDSGVGGLSVLRAIRSELPYESILFLADQAHVPYGPRLLEEVQGFAESITRFLISQNTKLVTVACNAASAAALHHLRRVFPAMPIVGMEPAVKPAAESTRSGVVGVLATPATFQGALYASVLERFASGVTILQDTCPGLVNQIEAGQLDGDKARAILEAALQPMLAQGIDTIVLGCTHYPFVIPLIQQIAGPQVRVVDPAPAVARQVRRRLRELGILNPQQTPGKLRFMSTGEPALLEALLPRLAGVQEPAQKITWRGQNLIENTG
jgi:glutamate racemase